VTVPAALHPGDFDPHASLRSATHATHIRLHGLAQFQAIAEGRLGRAPYADLLRSLHGYHAAIAQAAEAGGLRHLSTSPHRCSLLEADLASLGSSPAGERLTWTAPSREALYGALYVAEGSALGGRLIARQLDYLFGDLAEGRTFFRGAGNTGARWRAFLDALAQDCDEAAMPRMIAGAEAGFALFERCVTK
jgi:heme oxygenase (biliverdin-IX-beta and delta-forming)